MSTVKPVPPVHLPFDATFRATFRDLVLWRRDVRRFRHIRFGSRTDLYLPPGARLLVAVGQRMIGGETVMAELDPSVATPRSAIEF